MYFKGDAKKGRGYGEVFHLDLRRQLPNDTVTV